MIDLDAGKQFVYEISCAEGVVRCSRGGWAYRAGVTTDFMAAKKHVGHMSVWVDLVMPRTFL